MRYLLFVVAAMVMAAQPVFSGEIYIWHDAKGREHITNTPPPESAVVKEKARYDRANQDDIQEYQERQKKALDEGYRRYQVMQSANQADTHKTKRQFSVEEKAENRQKYLKERDQIRENYRKDTRKVYSAEVLNMRHKDTQERIKEACDKYKQEKCDQ